ncbi:unnamed protein product [Cuscuta epithymum]|uniref:CCHC-type domain-containing protein n=1 Tax=Cuscuta epithymum TaxID=186058 RepID=A0AAV0CRP9_9ASTE|nr:unnamed protein product [Cuscuta epithymum]
MEEIANKYKDMVIGDQEEELVFEEEALEGEDGLGKQELYPVVGTVITNKMVNFSALRNLMASLWMPGKGISIKAIDEKRYMFTFYHPIDMKRVLEDGPWIFEQNLLVLRALQPGDVPLSVPLNEAKFWVQVHDIPYDFMNLSVARRIGNFVGTFVNWEKPWYDKKWKPYMRVRACLDVGKPMKIGTTLRKGRGEGYWVDFKYEKLPSFCFSCGIIGHSDRFCPLVYEKDGTDTIRPYGIHLRAGGGGKARQERGNKWIISDGPEEESRAAREEGGSSGPGRKNWGIASVSASKGGGGNTDATAMEDKSGEPKRRRTWEESGVAGEGGETMVLDPKNGEGAGLDALTRHIP